MPSGLNLTTTRAFNRYGSVTSETRPGGRTRSFTYDVMKRPLTATDEIGVVSVVPSTVATSLPASVHSGHI